jgi:hypothetical protein
MPGTDFLFGSYDGTVRLRRNSQNSLNEVYSCSNTPPPIPQPEGIRIQGHAHLQGKYRDGHWLNAGPATFQLINNRTSYTLNIPVQLNNEGDFETNIESVYFIDGNQYDLTLKAPGYLRSRIKSLTFPDHFSGVLDFKMLVGGDVNPLYEDGTYGDNKINMLDLSYFGGKFGTNDSRADINYDGTVNIFDLTLVGQNYEKEGDIIVQ